MLLRSTDTHQLYGHEEALISLLITQSRYAEAYVLLQKETPGEPATQYNLALCHYWAGNYREALACLDKAQMSLPANSSPDNFRADQFYTAIRQRQNQLDDHRQGINKRYITLFGALVKDAIVRLKTDCWLQLGNYDQVKVVAAPLAHKNYKNITEALQAANQKNHES